MLHRPGAEARERNRPTSHAGGPGARGSKGLSKDGRLEIRQRILAPLKLAVPFRRTSQQATPDRSAATASRRVAVKSRLAGSPHNSPMTADSDAHLKPSPIAHSAFLASRASTWMRSARPNPGG